MRRSPALLPIAFGVFGVMWGAWQAVLPDLARHHGLTSGPLRIDPDRRVRGRASGDAAHRAAGRPHWCRMGHGDHGGGDGRRPAGGRQPSAGSRAGHRGHPRRGRERRLRRGDQRSGDGRRRMEPAGSTDAAARRVQRRWGRRCVGRGRHRGRRAPLPAGLPDARRGARSHGRPRCPFWLARPRHPRGRCRVRWSWRCCRSPRSRAWPSWRRARWRPGLRSTCASSSARRRSSVPWDRPPSTPPCCWDG